MGHGIVVGATNGLVDNGFNPGTGVNCPVSTIAIQADGKIVIGCFWAQVIGIRNSIARLNADGTLDTTFNPGTGANYNVQSIAIQSDGKIIVGGDFWWFNETNRNSLVRLNADGTLDTTFNPAITAFSAVDAIKIQTDGKILIGGTFSEVNGASRNGIARLNTDGTLDTTFNPGAGTVGPVFGITVQSDGKIVIGGGFYQVNGVSRNGIARLNTDGTLDTTFYPGTGTNDWVMAVALQPDGKVLIGGDFTQVNGTSHNRIARLNPDGTLDMTFDPGTGTNLRVSAVPIQPDGKVLIGGDFTQVNGTSRNRIARLNTDGTLDMTFDPGTGANDWVYPVFIQPDGRILIGGSFTQVNGQTNYRIARLGYDGSNKWKIYWDASAIQDQVINLRAFIGDNAQNGIQVFSNNVILDRTRPTVVSSSVSPSSVFPGRSVTINLQTQDNLSGVDHSDVYVKTATNGTTNGDWNLIGKINGCCGSAVWNTLGYPQGKYRIVFDVVDKAGNSNNWVFGSQPVITVPVFEFNFHLPFILK